MKLLYELPKFVNHSYVGILKSGEFDLTKNFFSLKLLIVGSTYFKIVTQKEGNYEKLL